MLSRPQQSMQEHLLRDNSSTANNPVPPASQRTASIHPARLVGVAKTPGYSRSRVAGGHDLVDYIQSSKASGQTATRAKPKATKVLVHVTVEIGDGRKGTIDVHEGEPSSRW